MVLEMSYDTQFYEKMICVKQWKILLLDGVAVNANNILVQILLTIHTN